MTNCPYCNKTNAHEVNIIVAQYDAEVKITYTCPDCEKTFSRVYTFSEMYDETGVRISR